MDRRIAYSSYTAVGTFGEPDIEPRVGEEYQAELPQILEESNSFSRSRNYVDGEIRDDLLHSFHVGSRIELAWISSSGTSSSPQQSEAKIFKKARTSCPSHDLRTSVEDSAEKLLVPETCDEEWTESEKDCFLLGLYAFAKNFVELKKFVETKDMRALHSYYYGKFYTSPEHHRWSQNRKTKHKEGTIFSGLRLKEFLLRLLPIVGDCKNAILEVSKSFERGKMSMAEYVFSLKAMVGAGTLLEAAGIGRTHRDLTAAAAKDSKSDPLTQAHHQLPSGKGYSSLTTAEIMDLLNGNQRLSKSRSSDLFWKAVWPRLLANGWHTEQYTGYKHASGSSPSLLFIIPGVENFARRRHTKGYHYFDSLSDVLREVARDPSLIGLNHEEGNSKENDEDHGRRRSHDEASNALAPKKKKMGMQENTQDQARTQDQTRPRLLIDLNLPPVNEDDGFVAAESSQEQNSTPSKPEKGEESSPSPMRYSTRQRPPTTRALEAFARGYLGSRRQKRKGASNDDHERS